jgi:hypothetical protein
MQVLGSHGASARHRQINVCVARRREGRAHCESVATPRRRPPDAAVRFPEHYDAAVRFPGHYKVQGSPRHDRRPSCPLKKEHAREHAYCAATKVFFRSDVARRAVGNPKHLRCAGVVACKLAVGKCPHRRHIKRTPALHRTPAPRRVFCPPRRSPAHHGRERRCTGVRVRVVWTMARAPGAWLATLDNGNARQKRGVIYVRRVQAALGVRSHESPAFGLTEPRGVIYFTGFEAAQLRGVIIFPCLKAA